MKMTSLEKKVVVVMVLCLAIIIGNFAYISYKVEKAGGLDTIIVEAGKEIKDIKRRINEGD